MEGKKILSGIATVKAKAQTWLIRREGESEFQTGFQNV
jgi:hypothetical protein